MARRPSPERASSRARPRRPSTNGSVPVGLGHLVMGLQLGCQVDLSEGGSLDVGADAASAPASVARQSAQRHWPVRRYQRRRFDQPAARDHHEPGLARKRLRPRRRDRRSQSACQSRRLPEDRCRPVFATAMIDTDKSDDSVNAYRRHPHAMRPPGYGSQQRPFSLVGWLALVPVGIAHATARRLGDISGPARVGAPPGDSSDQGRRRAGPRLCGLATATEL